MLATALPARLTFLLSMFALATACSQGGKALPEETSPPDLSRPADAAGPTDLSLPQRPSALYVVAHQDDDLLFMSLAMTADLERGVETNTVYLTAGDAGNGEDYWKRREDGARAAHALLDHANNDWADDPLVLGERTLVRQTLRSDPSQHLIFVRLPDGNLDGSGFGGKGSLQQLWEARLAALKPVDGASAYSQAELLDVLAALLEKLKPDAVHTQDSTNLYAPALSGGDHSDHIHGARFLLAASLRVFRPHALALHRGYDVLADHENLSSEQSARKWGVFATYAPYDMCFGMADTAACVGALKSGNYGTWCARESVVHRLAGLRTALGGPADFCAYAAATAGAAVELRACTSGDSQLWDVLPGGQVRGPGGLCMRPRGGQVADGTPIELAACAEVPEQSFRLLSSGQLMGLGGKCVVIAGGMGTDGAAVQLATCAQAAGQLWTVRRSLPYYASAGTDLSDTYLSSDANLARTLRLGDVSGDKKMDACVRRPQGLFCALGDGNGSLAPLALWSKGTDFSDTAGWSAPSWGLTVQLADVDGDGRADACGRTAAGLVCALSTGSGFGPAQRFSQGMDFGDLDGSPATDESYYGSLRFGDVNGDGRADACMRKSSGVFCAQSLGLTFSPATLYTTGFSDAEGWRSAEYGSTLQLGDVSGDGRADVCARGVYGMLCNVTTARGNAFASGSFWSFRGAFSDGEGWNASRSLYGSIRLADFDGDGKADVCGRSPAGLVCSLSTGPLLGPERPISGPEFTDARSWNNDRYGPTFQFADLDGDGRVEACGRGSMGLLCLRSPTRLP